MADIRKSLVITFFSTNSATAFQFVVTIFLARLLAPAEIGIFSITAVCISVAHIFRDFGVVSYLQREEHLTKEKVASAFGVLLTSSWLIALVTFFIGKPVAEYYGMPGIEEVMHVLALGFVFIPFGAITNSLLTREYKAKELAIVRAISTLTYGFTVLTLAYNGFSYMSMAWANLVNIIVSALALMPYKPAVEPWLPRFKDWSLVVNFGAGATLGNGLVQVNNAISDVVLGKLSGAHDVGIMSRSTSTPQLVNQIIGPTIGYAVLPYLAKAHHSGEGVAPTLQRGISYLTAIQWTAYLSILIYAEPLIYVLYGAKWLDCVPIVQVMCLALMVATPFGFDQNSYMAIGRPYLSSVPTGISIMLKLGCVAMLYQGELRSFAWAFVVAAIFLYPVQLAMQKHFLGLQISKSIVAQLKSIPVLIVCAISALVMRNFLPFESAFFHLAFASILLPVVWMLSMRFFHHPLLFEIRQLMKNIPFLNRF